MSARYTSPQLSRQLAEAGVEQKGDAQFGLLVYCHGEGEPHEQGDECERPIIRALDLTDVLEAIERLCGGIARREWEVNSYYGGYAAHAYGPAGRDHGLPLVEAFHDSSPVEAAGLVLLVLLRERRGPEETTDGNGFHEVGPRW